MTDEIETLEPNPVFVNGRKLRPELMTYLQIVCERPVPDGEPLTSAVVGRQTGVSSDRPHKTLLLMQTRGLIQDISNDPNVRDWFVTDLGSRIVTAYNKKVAAETPESAV